MAAVSNAQNNKMHIVFFWEYTRLKPTFFRSLLLRAASRFWASRLRVYNIPKDTEHFSAN
jgi:hypothetical protein